MIHFFVFRILSKFTIKAVSPVNNFITKVIVIDIYCRVTIIVMFFFARVEFGFRLSKFQKFLSIISKADPLSIRNFA